MKNNRRDFLKMSGIAGLGIMGGGIFPTPASASEKPRLHNGNVDTEKSIIGQYGPWANSRNSGRLPSLSFRRDEFTDLEGWRKRAMDTILDRLGLPELGPTPEVTLHHTYTYDGLVIEEISWQLPYGRATKAIVLKPVNAEGRLPAVLAFHDHGGNKYFGVRKITKTGDDQHEMMADHQKNYYEGRAWANDLAKRGYVVMVSDTFTFGSRRVLMEDVPEDQRKGLTDGDPENPDNIKAYNSWASDHEHIMAKSLFCSGTTWPAVFYAEDKVALDILVGRDDVDADRIGCGGLSGGGMRTVMSAGLDHRVKCAVCVGFMSTWTDFLLNKSFTHTWMAYVPRLPDELDFPEMLGLRVPLPTMVLNDEDDFLYTLPEMKKADGILQEVFAKAGAADRYKCSYYPGPHKFDKPMQEEAFSWWDQWLKS
ncbi:twin-arginine translocation signal domain-containing protein [Negadavirga shengliensis]|uniref:Twin-arginine translocation signal domain-containing protein n=1 Tax=Negadavirga shengliensis TaxID=1389218 RepID=A0ABV9T8R9_9BACT